MRWVLVALCACNRLLGLDDVRDRVPPDAPLTCPELGVTPVFSTVVHQALVQDCNDYALLSSGLAIGTCLVNGSFAVSQGMGSGELVPAGLGGSRAFGEPRPTPDGTLLLVRAFDSPNQTAQFHRDGTGWSYDYDVPIAAGIDGAQLGHIASDGAGGWRMMAADMATVEEWGSVAGGPWQRMQTIDVGALGVDVIYLASLTEDGLRMVMTAAVGTEPGMYYTDRASITSPFRAAQHLDRVPLTFAPYLDATCARIYLTGLGSVFYAQQQ